MKNNTTISISEAGSLILSRPYLLWLEKDVFPYIFGTTCLITILLGIIFSLAICKLFAKEKNAGIKRAIGQFVAVDILAGVFVLAPGIYTSYSKAEDLPHAYCIINGFFNLATFLIQFGILSLGLVTSLITLVKHKMEMDFPKMCKYVSSIVCICVVSIILSAIPVIWKDGYVYKTSEYQCGPNRSINESYFNVVLLIGVFVPLILALTVSVMLVKRFLSRNTKVAELRITQSEETVTMEDRTGSQHRITEQESNERRNRFKSDETVSMEDQTRSYGKTREDMSERKHNRFRSDVTISMEDQTKSYGKVPTQSGITVSMEDRRHSYSKKVKHFESDTATSSELTEFGRSPDPTVNCLRETSSSDTSLQTALDILNKDVSAHFHIPKVSDSGNDSDKGPCEALHDYPTGSAIVKAAIQHCSRDTDDEISFDGSYGPGIISRATSRSDRSTRSSAKSTNVPFKKTDGNVQTGKTNVLAKVLQSAATDKNKALKLATINVFVSFAVLACWSPFVTLVYIDAYGTLWWEGWLTVTVLCAYISYCIKPLVILSISGQLVQASKAILPKSLEDKTNRIASVLNQTIDKINKRIY